MPLMLDAFFLIYGSLLFIPWKQLLQKFQYRCVDEMGAALINKNCLKDTSYLQYVQSFH